MQSFQNFFIFRPVQQIFSEPWLNVMSGALLKVLLIIRQDLSRYMFSTFQNAMPCYAPPRLVSSSSCLCCFNVLLRVKIIVNYNHSLFDLHHDPLRICVVLLNKRLILIASIHCKGFWKLNCNLGRATFRLSMWEHQNLKIYIFWQVIPRYYVEYYLKKKVISLWNYLMFIEYSII